jgi:hypothetical protein
LLQSLCRSYGREFVQRVVLHLPLRMLQGAVSYTRLARRATCATGRKAMWFDPANPSGAQCHSNLKAHAWQPVRNFDMIAAPDYNPSDAQIKQR